MMEKGLVDLCGGGWHQGRKLGLRLRGLQAVETQWDMEMSC